MTTHDTAPASIPESESAAEESALLQELRKAEAELAASERTYAILREQLGGH